MSRLLRDKKKRPIVVFVIILPLLILIAVFSFLLFSGLLEDGEEKYQIESMDYHLSDEATSLQKDLFKELKRAVEKPEGGIQDDELIAGLVVKNFVADFYTWTNKQGQFDIGGMYYVYKDHKHNIYQYARYGFYYYLSDYIEEYGRENLLEVTSVETVPCPTGELEIDGVTYQTYRYSCNWTYGESTLDLKDYDTSCVFEVIKKDGRFEIIKAYQ